MYDIFLLLALPVGLFLKAQSPKNYISRGRGEDRDYTHLSSPKGHDFEFPPPCVRNYIEASRRKPNAYRLDNYYNLLRDKQHV